MTRQIGANISGALIVLMIATGILLCVAGSTSDERHG
jgi:hypothetical protein